MVERLVDRAMFVLFVLAVQVVVAVDTHSYHYLKVVLDKRVVLLENLQAIQWIVLKEINNHV